MKKICKIVAVVLCMALFVAAAPVSTDNAAAAEKVTKVTKTRKNQSGDKAYFLIKGKTASGKVVWSYKTSSRVQTELDMASKKVKGDFVYVIDYDKYVRLDKNTGKVLAKKKIGQSIAGAAMGIDDKGALYAIGYYGSTLYKFNKKGKIVWKHKFPSSVYWAYKIGFKDGKVIVTFDEGGKKSVDAETGK